MVVAARHRGIPEAISALDELADFPEAGWVVQVGAFHERHNALALAGRLARQAFPVAVRARLNDGLCHVLVGPYGRRVTAQAAQAQLARHWGLKSRLLPATVWTCALRRDFRYPAPSLPSDSRMSA